MTVTDVNEQLFQDRRAMIDSGRATRNDDGRWVYADKAEVIGREGLDTTLGHAALYTTTPAWHGLGNVIPGGVTDIDEVLRLGGIDFQVELREARYNFGGDLHTMPGHFMTVRSDTGAALGVVGRRYQVIQNRNLFEFLQDLVANHGVIWESAGALRDGRKVFVGLRLPENVVVDEGGINDEIVPFINAINSHDGTSKAETVVTPWRIVCGNTERFAVQDSKSRWGIRHTSNALTRLDEARRTLGLSVTYFEQFAAEETQLARTDLALGEFDKLIADLWPADTDDDDTSQRATTIRDHRTAALHDIFLTETERVGRTAYAAERAVTDYLDHLAPLRPGKNVKQEIARAAQLVEGTDDAKKSAAHRRLMTLTTR